MTQPLVDETHVNAPANWSCAVRRTESVIQNQPPTLQGLSSQRVPFPAETAANKITAISPPTITAGINTAITLTGTVAAGDLVTWAADCAAATPDVDPTDGTDQSTGFTVGTAGVYKLCYRASGLADSVEQAGITLTVAAGAFHAHERHVHHMTQSPAHSLLHRILSHTCTSDAANHSKSSP